MYNIFETPNLISIEIRNHTMCTISIGNGSSIKPSERVKKLEQLGYTIKSFKDELNINPGLLTLFTAKPRILSMSPVTLNRETNTPEVITHNIVKEFVKDAVKSLVLKSEDVAPKKVPNDRIYGDPRLDGLTGIAIKNPTPEVKKIEVVKEEINQSEKNEMTKGLGDTVSEIEKPKQKRNRQKNKSEE